MADARTSDIETPDQSGTDRETASEPPDRARRRLLATAGKVAMIGGLTASYGTCAAFSGRFLYPAKPQPSGWQFVIEADNLAVGDALTYRAPDGAPISVARQSGSGGLADFIALSQTCPHLGCQVHWEPQHDRFFCPCHNGVFTPQGKAVSGPPAEAGQDLPRYPLKIEDGLLYIEVPLAALSDASHLAPTSWPGGHDPCLKQPPKTEQS